MNVRPFVVIQGKRGYLLLLLQVIFFEAEFHNELIDHLRCSSTSKNGVKQYNECTYLSSRLGTSEHDESWTPVYLHVKEELKRW